MPRSSSLCNRRMLLGFCTLKKRVTDTQIDDETILEITTSPTNTVKIGVASIDEDDSTSDEILYVPLPDLSSWCTSDTECPGSQLCIDQSNGNCFFSPCGRCYEVNPEESI